jgi:hypothetical protein
MIGAGCFFWLERLQPIFFAVALLALAYQLWLVRRRPSTLRSWRTRVVLAASLGVNAIVAGSWIVLMFRYR